MLVNPNNPAMTQSNADINVLVQSQSRKDDTLGSYIVPKPTGSGQNLHLRANTNVFAIMDNTSTYASVVVHPSYDGQCFEFQTSTAISNLKFAKPIGGVTAAQSLSTTNRKIARFSDVKGWIVNDVAVTTLT